MPAKTNWSQYFNKLNKTLQNFEYRIENLEKQVGILSKSGAQMQLQPQQITYKSPLKRRLGWGLVWIGIFLFLLSFFTGNLIADLGLGTIIPYWYSSILNFGIIIAGIIMLIANPKEAATIAAATGSEEKIDISEELIQMPQASSKMQSPKASKAQAKKSEEKGNLESDIGKKWLPKIGIISIVLGVAFFVIYAIQNKWIGPTGQVAIGVLAGICLVVAGEFFERKDYHNYAMTLVGGGFAIIYFSMFAAYRFYGLLPLAADVAAISVIIIAAVYFSARYNSKIIASEAFLLGYIVPLLTSSVNTYFLIYSIALTLGLVVLSCIRNWKILGAIGMVAMYISHIFWLNNYNGPNQSLLHIMFLLIYFLMFSAMAWKISYDEKKEIDSWLSRKILFAAVFIASYLFLFAVDFGNFFYICIPLVLMIFLLAFFTLNFDFSYFVIGGILFTYILHWRWLYINFKESSLVYNFVGLLVYFVLFNILLFMLSSQKSKSANIAAILVNSAVYYGLNSWVGFYFNTGLKGLFTASLSVFYLVFAYLAYQKKISHYFNTYIILCFGYLALTIPIQFNQEWVTISWAALTLMLVLLSFRLKENSIRVSSSIIGVITMLRVLFYDSWKLHAFDISDIIGSTRLFAFLSVIVIFYIIAYLYYKNKDSFVNYEQYVMYVNAFYAITATLLITVIIWIEIWDTRIALNAKKLWTSLAFIIQAIVVLSFGFKSKIKLFRIMGLLLFGLSILKVFLYDLSSLETGYRIISFIVLGIIALLGAFLYNKFKEHI